ncbi:transposase [Streptomyces sp. NPDC096132]|uniref:transposase n=1 Tax=Streptomyces sp. NPDC096132 TaxID=3366075 RepID=UPI00380C6E3C
MADLAHIPVVGQVVKDAAVQKLAEDVRSARGLLATAREVLAEQEKAELDAKKFSDLTRVAGEELQDVALSDMREVIDLLGITVKPLGEARKRSGVKCKVTEWHALTGTLVPADVLESVWPVVEELMTAYFRRRQFARGAVDVRTQLNGILHRLRTGCLWDVPPLEVARDNTAVDQR